MADDTDEPGRLFHFPPGDRPLQLPDTARLFPEPENDETPTLVGAEIPDSGFMLPEIVRPMNPEDAISVTNSDGLDLNYATDSSGGDLVNSGASETGASVPRRSLADRIGDWIEFRINRAQARHDAEAPYRDAEVARKAELLKARTGREAAAIQHNGKLDQAKLKARADLAAARSKAADRTRSPSSGLGMDKGRSKAGAGGSGRGAGGRGSGTNGHGAGGHNSSKGARKGSDRSADGRSGRLKGNESSGGSKGRQNRSGGSGSSKGSKGKGSTGGSGKGGSKGDGGRTHKSPAVSPRAERSRGRQERAAARQEARQQRRSANQAANIADRSKDRDQDRANRQTAREERHAAKVERKAARKAKREAAKTADDRTTLGEAIAEEAQRRWDKRHADAQADNAETQKANLSKDKETKGTRSKGKQTPKNGPEKPAEGPEESSAAGTSNGAGKAPGEPSEASGEGGGRDPRDSSRRASTGTDNNSAKGGRRQKRRGRKPHGEQPTPGPVPADSVGITVERTDRTTQPDPNQPKAQAPRGLAPNRPGLPPAPEPHTQRPGTTRPTSKENRMGANTTTATSGNRQQGLAKEHQTDITFDEYLMEIASIAVAANADKERAEELADGLKKLADALQDMATDLVGDHNIDTKVTDAVSNLADHAGRMKLQAEQCATACDNASQAAIVAGQSVANTYKQDLEAMDDAGLTHASAAAHH